MALSSFFTPRKHLLWLLFLLGSATCQSLPHTFNWAIQDTASFNLSQCSTHSITATPMNDSVKLIAPFSMLAFSPAGVVQSSIGTFNGSLQWTIPFPSGSQMMMSVVDSGSSQGGVGGLYTVTSGSSDSCLNLPSSSNAQIALNATSLGPCDPLLVAIAGGVKPFNLMIVISGNPFISVRMGPNDDEFIWFNVAPPNSNVLIAAADSSGKFAVAKNFVTTVGGANNCTRQGISTQDNDAQGRLGGQKSNGAVIGAVIGGIAALLIVAGAVLYFWRYYKQDRTSRYADIKLDATPYSLSDRNQTQTDLGPLLTSPPIDPNHPTFQPYQDDQSSNSSYRDRRSTYQSGTFQPTYQSPSTYQPSTYQSLSTPLPTPGSSALSRDFGDQQSSVPLTSVSAPITATGQPRSQKAVIAAQERLGAQPGTTLVMHRDAGPVEELPPSYGEQL